MPYCSQCGNRVGDTDLYCYACGVRQAAAAPPASSPFSRAAQSSGISPRTASLLCYLPFVGWIGAIIVLASDRFRANRTVRFHAFQGLYLFVAWLLVRWVIRPLPFFFPGPHIPVDAILQLGLIAVWVFMLVKVSHDQVYSLPILGELAEKSVSES
jgi:uncharacterized membrane protein